VLFGTFARHVRIKLIYYLCFSERLLRQDATMPSQKIRDMICCLGECRSSRLLVLAAIAFCYGMQWGNTLLQVEPGIANCTKIPTDRVVSHVFGSVDPRVVCVSENPEECAAFSNTLYLRFSVTCIDDLRKWGYGPRCEYAVGHKDRPHTWHLSRKGYPVPLITNSGKVFVTKINLKCPCDENDGDTVNCKLIVSIERE